MAAATTSPLVYLKPELAPDSLILRPVTAEECRRAAGEIFDRLLAAQHEGADCFVVKSRDERIRVPYRKILYFEARERRLCLRMAGEELTFTGTLEKLLETLPPEFRRVHRSFVVNADNIQRVALSQNLVYLRGDVVVPLSRSYKRRCGSMTHDENTAMERSYHPTGAELWFCSRCWTTAPRRCSGRWVNRRKTGRSSPCGCWTPALPCAAKTALPPAAPLAPLLDTVKSADRAALVFLRTPGGAVDAVLYYNRVGGVLLRRESAARYTLQKALDTAALLAALPPLNGAGRGRCTPSSSRPQTCRRWMPTAPPAGRTPPPPRWWSCSPRLHAAGPLAMAGHRLRLQGTPPDARQRDHRPPTVRTSAPRWLPP